VEVQTALVRCPSCGAGVRPDAAWCTLCFAPMRPPPHDTPGGDAPRARGAHAAAAEDTDSLAPPVDELERLTRAADTGDSGGPERPAGRHAQAAPSAEELTAGENPADVAQDGAPCLVADPSGESGEAVDADEPHWPCGACGHLNPMDADACASCFRPFLSDLAGSPLTLPVVGDLRRLSTGARYGLAFGVAVVASGLIVAVLVVIGTFV
jgi:hypothetical protein